MKSGTILALSLVSAVAIHAQVPSSSIPSSSHTRVRPAATVPESARAPKALRASTAESAPARINHPLPMALPDFAVRTREGLSVPSASLVQKAHWLMIYRLGTCLACDRLMNVIAAGPGVTAGKGQAYTVVVAGSDSSALDRVHGAFPALVNATWVADPTNQAAKVLNLHAAPVLYAMEGSHIAWSVAGSLGNPSMLEQKATAWLLAPMPPTFGKAVSTATVVTSEKNTLTPAAPASAIIAPTTANH